MAETYYTCHEINKGFRRCNVPHTFSLTKIKQYAERNKLLVNVDNIQADDETKIIYIKKRISYLFPHSNLQKLIDGMNIPVKISDLEESIFELQQGRIVERERSKRRKKTYD